MNDDMIKDLISLAESKAQSKECCLVSEEKRKLLKQEVLITHKSYTVKKISEDELEASNIFSKLTCYFGENSFFYQEEECVLFCMYKKEDGENIGITFKSPITRRIIDMVLKIQTLDSNSKYWSNHFDILYDQITKKGVVPGKYLKQKPD